MKNYVDYRWYAEDVQDIRPDLSTEQAMNVLLALKESGDATLGVNWDVIESMAENLYPEEV